MINGNALSPPLSLVAAMPAGAKPRPAEGPRGASTNDCRWPSQRVTGLLGSLRNRPLPNDYEQMTAARTMCVTARRWPGYGVGFASVF